ncbi:MULTISPECIES: DUF1697 domain-containing protein [unclassified Pseudonocardia]|uniref:DUF1697 domain-containing protein n=1 Tax=unclassified Pseudonocardia TaxID=2619320 RepID=UPI0001FFDCAC|nr:DUF1697 domain-containing protein [Pseudonocardia sp. Ae707_Ps1]OLM16925.1 hypothetical protein Ae707Ps1_1184c [Pseudonocardia sp. Ae707_Ps1]
MRTHVALLRGINVGGTGKVPMADLRRVLAGRGFTDVATYIQSGNVVLTSTDPDPGTIADEIAGILQDDFGLDRPVVAFGRDEYAAAVAANPFPQVSEPKQLHAVFLAAPPDDAGTARLEAALAVEREQGGPGDAAVVGRVVYLHLPDGIGRSRLAARLSTRTGAADGGGTARNWATVRKLRELLG